jgi:predicted nuclease of restriction endonuclease-like (RecB) superfamily
MSEEGVALKAQSSIDTTYQNIRAILEKARSTAYRAVNFAMVQAYWGVGRIIVEEEQKGEERAEYGKALIKELSVRLTRDYGKGFIERNLWYMRDFYLTFPKVNALRSELTWTHYRLLLKVEKEEARNFYMLESVKNNWSTRVLERQINSLLYERLALSKDRQTVLELSTKGLVIQEPADIIKDPYVLEFLDLKESRNFLEKDLEHALIDKLQAFLLEPGKDELLLMVTIIT